MTKLEQLAAYSDGVLAGQIDRTLREEPNQYSFNRFHSDGEYHKHFSEGYRKGWNKSA